jgi:antirestriction protein ArdC
LAFQYFEKRNLTMSEKNDERKKAFVDELMAAMKENKAPWQRGWDKNDMPLPYNAVSGKRYSSSNAIHLMMVGEKKGYHDPRFLTFNQIRELGGHVNKGEKGHTITMAALIPDKHAPLKENGEPNEKMMFKTATVFNAAQVTGLPEYKKPELTWSPNEAAEKLLQASKAVIHEKPINNAYYSPTTDEITLPQRTSFKTPEDYYATALHELGHWTGHESRLNRDLKHEFGSEGYAKEELVAEISSMLMSRELGVKHNVDNHAAYTKFWLKALENDPNEIFKAVSKAEKVVDYVIGLSPDLKRELENSRKVEANLEPKIEPQAIEAPQQFDAPVQQTAQTEQTQAPKARTQLELEL